MLEFREHFNPALEEALLNDELERQSKWTEAIAVGQTAYVEAIEGQIRSRQRMLVGQEEGAWLPREEYRADSGPEKWPLDSSERAFLS